MSIRLLAALAILILASGVSAGEGSGTAELGAEIAAAVDLSSAQVTLEPPGPYLTAVGLPFEVEVRVEVPSSVELVSVSVGGNRHIELSQTSALVPTDDGAFRQTLELVVFRSGEFTARGIEALVIDGNGVQHRISSGPLVVAVESRIVNENNPMPAPSDPPLTVLSRDMRPIYAGSALGFVGLGVLIAALWRRRNKGEEGIEEEEEVRRPAWEVALEALDALEAEGMLEDGRHLEFHMRLSEILREYIGARFSFLALEMTTTEIARALSDRETGEYRDELLEVLRDMDLVKFAKFTPSRDLSTACFESVSCVVTELSARERQESRLEIEHSIETSEPAEETSGGDQPAEDAHAPSPDSTTVSFSQLAEEAPENIVAFRSPGPSLEQPIDRVWDESGPIQAPEDE